MVTVLGPKWWVPENVTLHAEAEHCGTSDHVTGWKEKKRTPLPLLEASVAVVLYVPDSLEAASGGTFVATDRTTRGELRPSSPTATTQNR